MLTVSRLGGLAEWTQELEDPDSRQETLASRGLDTQHTFLARENDPLAYIRQVVPPSWNQLCSSRLFTNNIRLNLKMLFK